MERLEKGENEIGYGASETRRLATRAELDAYFDLLKPLPSGWSMFSNT
jgi:hypothetical protein